jgi:hypothetical protein
MFAQVNTRLDSKGASYLKQVLYQEKVLSDQRIKTILTASILRYLEGRTTLQFILDICSAVSDEKEIRMNGDLVESVTLLNYLGYQITFHKLDKDTVENRLRNILEKLMR